MTVSPPPPPDLLTERPSHKRTDIQALRALAVLLVLLYHAGASAVLPRGYLGVDVFFVISGFLVTKMIVDDLDRGQFSFGAFYARRARRLLPAAYCTFALTLLAAAFFLTQNEHRDFLKQLAGAVSFTANIVLWQQTGYFEITGALKPLLHTWSLSLEEQFYLLLPLLLVMIGAAKRVSATAILFVLSLGLYLFAANRWPSAAFFLLPTRAWELLMGSLLTLLLVRRPRVCLPSGLMAACVVMLVAVPSVPANALPPGLDAVLVTLATALLLAGRYRLLENPPAAKRLAHIGDWSYSLYLVHWPLFAFAANAYATDNVPASIRAALLALAFVLGYLQYRWVERPTRNAPAARLAPAFLVASIALLASLPLYSMTQHGARDYAEIRRAGFGMGTQCDSSRQFDAKPTCATSSTPVYAVWGDSFAAHLVPGLKQLPLAQVTRSSCQPILGVADVTAGSAKDRNWAQSCIEFNDSAYRYLRDTHSIETVVLSSTFLLSGPNIEHLRGDAVSRLDQPVLVEAVSATIAALRSAGKKVVIVAFPPWGGFDMGICLERLEAGLVTPRRSDCDFREPAYIALAANRIALLRAVQDDAGVTVLWPHELLCRDGVCRSRINGKFVYRDTAHFSTEGAIEFAREFDLARKIGLHAR